MDFLRKAAAFFAIITDTKGTSMKTSNFAASVAALAIAGCMCSHAFNPDVNSAVSPDGKNEIRIIIKGLNFASQETMMAVKPRPPAVLVEIV